jgi:hypothetical protein
MKLNFNPHFLFKLFLPAQFSLVASAQTSVATTSPTLANLISAVRTKPKSLESSPAERHAYESFLATHKLTPGSVSHSDFILVRLIFEATRDAGFWNMQKRVTFRTSKRRSDEFPHRVSVGAKFLAAAFLGKLFRLELHPQGVLIGPQFCLDESPSHRSPRTVATRSVCCEPAQAAMPPRPAAILPQVKAETY